MRCLWLLWRLQGGILILWLSPSDAAAVNILNNPLVNVSTKHRLKNRLTLRILGTSMLSMLWCVVSTNLIFIEAEVGRQVPFCDKLPCTPTYELTPSSSSLLGDRPLFCQGNDKQPVRVEQWFRMRAALLGAARAAVFTLLLSLCN